MEDVCEELELRLRRGDWSDRPEQFRAWLLGTEGVQACIAAGLRGAASESDWLRFELLVLAGHLVPSREFTPALTAVLDLRSDEVNNEDVVELLDAIVDPAAVDALERALWWQPGWDEFHALGVKCVSALARIGSDGAWRVVEDAAAVGPAEVRRAAFEELGRR